MSDWLPAGSDLMGADGQGADGEAPADGPPSDPHGSGRGPPPGGGPFPSPLFCITTSQTMHPVPDQHGHGPARPRTSTATGGDPAAQNTPKPPDASTAVRQDSPTTRRPLFHGQGNPFP